MKITVFIDSPIDYDQPLKGKAAFLRRDVTGFFINHPEWVTALWGQERAKQIERIQRNGSSNLQPVRGGLVVRRLQKRRGGMGRKRRLGLNGRGVAEVCYDDVTGLGSVVFARQRF